MNTEIVTNNPEKEQPINDNARKFLTVPLDDSFFDDRQVVSFDLVVDWLETDEASEKKLAYKTFEDGKKQILLISKVTQADGSRKTIKEPLDVEDEERYHELVGQSILHLEKKRHEFTFTQNGIAYDMKYDIFDDDKLHMVEVDAKVDADRAAFNPDDLPGALEEVTGDLNYYGYRVCSILLS